MVEVLAIPLNLIDPSPFQMRQEMEEDSLKALAQSLEHDGLQRPVQARPVGGRYQLAYGHRTVEAAKMLGWKEIQATVKELTDREMAWAIYAENRFREDWNDYAYARWFKQMIDEHGYTQESIAEEANMSRNRVNQLLRMLQLGEKVTIVTLSKLKEGQAREILSKPVNDQDELCAKVEEYVEVKGKTPTAKEIKKLHRDVIHDKYLDEEGVIAEDFNRMNKEHTQRQKARSETDKLTSFYGVPIYDAVLGRMKVTGFETRKKYLRRYVERLHVETPIEEQMKIIGRLEYD